MAAISRACPICKKPSVEEFRPFCSARCRDVDLNRWLNGSYAIPVKDEETSEQSVLSDDGDDPDADL